MLSKLYKNRFDGKVIIKEKNELWKVLCRNFFQKFIPENSTVVDLAAGYCEFINNIKAQKKIAVDLNNDTKEFAKPGVNVLIEDITKLSLNDSSADIVFISNLFEHLNSREEILKVLNESYRILKSNGIIIILQPNINYIGTKYWDFFDHKIALSDKSLAEALRFSNFKILKLLPRFLPYTTKSGLPKWPFLVKLYLKYRLLWNLFGQQCLIIAEK
jgi:ubiquinone/menaquinone biosynthesis C-methylase UbiE